MTAARWILCAATVIGLGMIAWAYWPGLAGPFLFDDYGNLNALGAYGRVDRWPAFLYYLTSGNADPTGRPVALLSFLLDARDWPAAPWAFKRTNLILHLVNTVLLALTLTRLQAGIRRRRPDIPVSSFTPLLGAMLWGAHPFFVSTTLYVVQREAMLPMTFVLLAILAWDRAVLHFTRHRNQVAWVWAIVGMSGATLLAGFSKANGFLAPLLVGLAYLYCLRPIDISPRRRWRMMDTAAALCLGLPSLLVIAYLLHTGTQLWSLPQLPGRDWTLPERLLSEPRAVWTYIARLLLLRGGGGVFVDDFATSRGWLDPVTTLPAALALLTSVVAAISLRRRIPIISFAWLFFLATQLLESSVVPLELYFEHRAYLSAAFLGWPLAHALSRRSGYERYQISFATLLVSALLLLTYQRAVIWGNPEILAKFSAMREAGSPRSQVSAARQEIDRGDMRAGLTRSHAQQRGHADSVDIAISAIGIECAATGALTTDTLERTRRTLATSRNWNYSLYEWMQDAARDPNLGQCHGFGLPGLTLMVASAESNPQSATPTRRRDLWHVRGRIALAEGMPELALRWFDAALLLKPDADYALVQAAALGDAGAPALGVRHLDHYVRLDAKQTPQKIHDMAAVHVWLLQHYGYYDRELSELRQQLTADTQAHDTSAQRD